MDSAARPRGPERSLDNGGECHFKLSQEGGEAIRAVLAIPGPGASKVATGGMSDGQDGGHGTISA